MTASAEALSAPGIARGSEGQLRVAVVHDYLTQRGGAERVVLSLMEAFPGARLVTSVYNPDATFPEFAQFDVETTWLNRVPAFQRDPRRALALLPTAFSGVDLTDVDVVICSSSGWSHAVSTKAPKIVYCHNPARWIYQRGEYLDGHGAVIRGMAKVLSPYLRWRDRRAAHTVHSYLANSGVVAGRIEQEYGISADVLFPAVTIDPHAPQTPVSGVEPGFLLTVSRPRGYKNVEVVCEGVEELPGERLVVVGELPAGTWSERIAGVGRVSDAQLRWLYANCSAVVAASYEDFGLTPVEGYSFGKPALCLRAGGFLETMVEGVSGLFIENLTPEAVRQAISDLRHLDLDDRQILRHADSFGFARFRDALEREIAQALRSA